MINTGTLDVFIGYDPAEPVAYHVCSESLIRNSSVPLAIHPLYLKQLNMKTVRCLDGYPPSNGFIFSRFLVPHLMRYKGLAVFIDGDMVVEADIVDLVSQMSLFKAVGVVKHDYKTSRKKKYLGAVNEDYPRKNWSSVIVWNCGHYHNEKLTPEFVGNQSGEYLHRFQWLDDDLIVGLNKSWNVLADEPNQSDQLKLIHYTLGTPCFDGFQDCEHSDRWFRHYGNAVHPLVGSYEPKRQAHE